MLASKVSIILTVSTMAFCHAAYAAEYESRGAMTETNGFSFARAGEYRFLRYRGVYIFTVSVGDIAVRDEVIVANSGLSAEYSVKYVSNKVTDVFMASRDVSKFNYWMGSNGLQRAQWERMSEFPVRDERARVFTLHHEVFATAPLSELPEKLDLSWVKHVTRYGHIETNAFGNSVVPEFGSPVVTVKSCGLSNCVVIVEGKPSFAVKMLSQDVIRYILFTNGIPHYAAERTIWRSEMPPSTYTLYGDGEGGSLPAITYVDDDGDGLLDRYYVHSSCESGKITYSQWNGPSGLLGPADRKLGRHEDNTLRSQ